MTNIPGAHCLSGIYQVLIFATMLEGGYCSILTLKMIKLRLRNLPEFSQKVC